ncbi:MAG: SGNH/GDSL hydrolase family protein [Acidimicrobiales bacterium]
MKQRWSLAACLVTVVVTACSGGSGPTAGPMTGTAVAPGDVGDRVAFVTLGGDETLGQGLDDSLRQSWPQLLFRQALPQRTVHVNLAAPDATVAEALDNQLPAALELQPTLAAVWLTGADVAAGTPVRDYERNLDLIVRQLQATARVVVATGPTVPGAPRSVDPYNAAVRRVAEGSGADLVDLSALDTRLDEPASARVAELFGRVVTGGS